MNSLRSRPLPLTEQAREELERLLTEVVVTPKESILRRGKHVDLVVSVWDSPKDPDKFDVLVSAYDPKRAERYTLEGFRLSANAQRGGTQVGKGGTLVHEGFRLSMSAQIGRTSVGKGGTLTPRGDIAIDGLPRNVGAQRARRAGKHELVRVKIPIRLAAAGGPAAGTARTRGQEAPSQVVARSVDLADGGIVVTARRLRDRNLSVAAATCKERLAGTTVGFAFRERASGRTLAEGTRRLPSKKNMPDGYIDSRPLDPPLLLPAPGPRGEVQCDFEAWVISLESGDMT